MSLSRRYVSVHEASHAVTACMLGVTPERVALLPHGGGVNMHRGGFQAGTLTLEQAVAVVGGHRLAGVRQQLVLWSGGQGEQHQMSLDGVPLADRVATSLRSCAADYHAIQQLDRVCGPLPSAVLVALHGSVTGRWWKAIEAVAVLLDIFGEVDGKVVAAIVASG